MLTNLGHLKLCLMHVIRQIQLVKILKSLMVYLLNFT